MQSFIWPTCKFWIPVGYAYLPNYFQFLYACIGQVYRQLSSRIRMEPVWRIPLLSVQWVTPDIPLLSVQWITPDIPLLSVQWITPDIPLLSVQWITPDDGQRNCPKHVEFHFQNKIWEISASSFFYYKEICHDARSHECHDARSRWTSKIFIVSAKTNLTHSNLEAI
jgi:hypothetical protein